MRGVPQQDTPLTMLVAAVDVGTGSTRAGIFDTRGRLLGRAEAPISTQAPAENCAEQNSTEIWAATAAALRAARAEAAARPEDIAGLAFDATCSLVLRDAAPPHHPGPSIQARLLEAIARLLGETALAQPRLADD